MKWTGEAKRPTRTQWQRDNEKSQAQVRAAAVKALAARRCSCPACLSGERPTSFIDWLNGRESGGSV